jgi:arsenate reductase
MSQEFPVTIYHYPKCGTSRKTLAMIEAAGFKPQIVPYVTVGWTRPLLERLLAAMGKTARDIMRTSGTPAAALGLMDPATSDEAILTAMLEYPLLVERPIVESPLGVKLCRPIETVQSLLKR